MENGLTKTIPSRVDTQQACMQLTLPPLKEPTEERLSIELWMFRLAVEERFTGIPSLYMAELCFEEVENRPLESVSPVESTSSSYLHVNGEDDAQVKPQSPSS